MVKVSKLCTSSGFDARMTDVLLKPSVGVVGVGDVVVVVGGVEELICS